MRRCTPRILLLIVFILALGVAQAGPRSAPTRPKADPKPTAGSVPAVAPAAGSAAVATRPPASRRVQLGIDVLAAGDFVALRGKRVGLLTHPAGVDSQGRSTVEVLKAAPGVNLRALFGPEHGIYGNEKADVPVDDAIDPRTGLPVYSLYGKYRRPSPQMLEKFDVMVVDLQDIGSRSYTYISCLKNVMEECFKAGKEVIVLDRPNPLGGLKVDGPGLDEPFISYVGIYPIPYVHGLTIGELARMAKDTPGWLKIPDAQRRQGRLTVIPMRGWTRSMLWPETGLRWVATSPAIPDTAAAFGYPMTGLGCQLGGFRHGYGTALPFRLLQYKGRTPEQILAELEARRIPGLRFRIIPFTERGEQRRAVLVEIADWQRLRPTELSFHLMMIAAAWEQPSPFATAAPKQAELYNKHVGDADWWREISTRGPRADLPSFLARWEIQNREFQRRSRAYWLYP